MPFDFALATYLRVLAQIAGEVSYGPFRPVALVAPVAGLLAFSAWLAGDGALAWCAVDRCLCADPDHVLGQLVGEALTSAMPPSSWRPIDPGSLALFAG